MIIWSGWGFLVVVFAAVGLFAGVFISSLVPGAHNVQMATGMVAGGLLAGGATLLLARWRESKPGRSFTDNATGEQVRVRPSAGSLFFIPTRIWAYILPLVGLFFAWAVYTDV